MMGKKETRPMPPSVDRRTPRGPEIQCWTGGGGLVIVGGGRGPCVGGRDLSRVRDGRRGRRGYTARALDRRRRDGADAKRRCGGRQFPDDAQGPPAGRAVEE